LTADETIARVLAHKDILGITRVANLTGLDRTGVPVVMVCRPNARSSATARESTSPPPKPPR
jgi:ribosomal protein S12 methylthiotransferase accessory factor